MKRFFVQMANPWNGATSPRPGQSNIVFEEVDEYTFNHRKLVSQGQDDPTPRYAAAYVLKDGDDVTLSGTVSTTLLGIICRFLQVTVPTGAVDGGWLREASFVFLRPPRGNLILHQFNGVDFVQKKAA